MLTRVFHLHALSALHVGVGQAIGVVDLPIARARSTQLPIVPGSALKGVMRDELSESPHRETLFGPERIDGPNGAHAGALAFGDAQLLIFPVRSFAGVMAYVTCPFVLTRFAEDCRRAGCLSTPKVPELKEEEIMLTSSSVIKVGDDHVVLEDLDLVAKAGADGWADRDRGARHAPRPSTERLGPHHRHRARVTPSVP
jgi:CRISPR-associated protein Cmr4